jgi:nucleoside-triphosphatase
MECFSQVFIETTTRVLDGPLPVLATIAAKGGGFISQVKARRDIEVFAVTVATRDGLPERLAERLLPA